MKPQIFKVGYFVIVFALMGLLIPTLVINNVDAAHISPCTKEGLSITIEGVTDHVEIKSYSFSASTQTTTSGSQQSTGQPQFSNIVVMKTIDENTPRILENIARGTVSQNAHIQTCYPIGNPNNFATFEIG